MSNRIRLFIVGLPLGAILVTSLVIGGARPAPDLVHASGKTPAEGKHRSEDSPYAGQEQREIKALSTEEVEGLLAGKGLEFAKAAELNSYPGPRHVLDLSTELELSAGQQEQSQALFHSMQARARELGGRIVERERHLDALFAERAIDLDQLKLLTGDIAVLRGRLRAVHLAAHLEMSALLTQEQVIRYQHLRGYGIPGMESGKAHSSHH